MSKWGEDGEQAQERTESVWPRNLRHTLASAIAKLVLQFSAISPKHTQTQKESETKQGRWESLEPWTLKRSPSRWVSIRVQDQRNSKIKQSYWSEQPKEFYTRVSNLDPMYEEMKWHECGITFLTNIVSFHSSKISPNLRSQFSNMGPILSPKVRSIEECFGAPSFLDMNPNLNLPYCSRNFVNFQDHSIGGPFEM